MNQGFGSQGPGFIAAKGGGLEDFHRWVEILGGAGKIGHETGAEESCDLATCSQTMGGL